MANKLRELFLRKNTNFVTFVFKDEKYRKDFNQKILQLQSNFETEYVDLDGVVCINSIQPTPVGEYKSSNNQVTDIRVFPDKEKIHFIVQTPDENYALDLFKITKSKGSIFSTSPKSPIDLRLTFNGINKQLNIKCKINYSLCDNASEWRTSLSTIINFLLYFVDPPRNSPSKEIQSIFLNLYSIKNFFDRIQKLESAFDTHFSTINLTDSKNDTLNIELLYQAIVKGIPIKENISYTDISSPVESSVSLPNIGTKQLLQYDQVETIIIDKQEFSLYTKQFFFNAVVNAIEKEDETNNKIVFTGTDEKPLYSVKKYYLSSSDAPKLTGDITEYVLPIMNAKTLSEILSDLEKQERTEVEELLKKGRKNIKLKFDKIECTTEDNSNQ